LATQGASLAWTGFSAFVAVFSRFGKSTIGSLRGNEMGAPPEWVDRLVQELSGLFHYHSENPLGCHWHQAEEVWEISVFMLRLEVLGGARDGENVALPFHLDLQGLPGILESVESLSWQSTRLGDSDDLGQHISLTGTYAGQSVWLRILAEPPAEMPTAGTLCSRTLDVRIH
jgi:hypothetical protein